MLRAPMGEVEQTLKLNPKMEDDRRWEWLCESVKKLVDTPHFERYPNWRARAWIAAADLHRARGTAADELHCLEHAIAFDEKAAVKRRINALEQKLASEHPANE